MKVIMTGGGTGGHIYPAIAIADKIKKKEPDSEILFVGTKQGMEKDIVPANGYPIEYLTVRGLNRKNPIKNLKTVKELLRSMKDAKQIIADFQPDVVMGTGGYVCGPMVYAAHRKGIPTFIHEQNALPGLTNKILAHYVDKIFISFEESKAHFKQKDKLILTGNPIRKVFITDSINDNRSQLGIKENEFMVLIFGGSRGAGKINEIVTQSLGAFKETENLKIFFITGKSYYDHIIEKTEEKKSENIKIIGYTDEIHKYMLAADLIVCRSGALTVSEINACGKPSILVPSPNVTNDHQYFNAKVVSDKGGAVLMKENDFTSDKLVMTIMRLMGNRELLNKMGKYSGQLGKTDAVEIIYDQIK